MERSSLEIFSHPHRKFLSVFLSLNRYLRENRPNYSSLHRNLLLVSKFKCAIPIENMREFRSDGAWNVSFCAQFNLHTGLRSGQSDRTKESLASPGTFKRSPHFLWCRNFGKAQKLSVCHKSVKCYGNLQDKFQLTSLLLIEKYWAAYDTTSSCWSCSWLPLEDLLRICRAQKTSCVLHIWAYDMHPESWISCYICFIKLKLLHSKDLSSFCRHPTSCCSIAEILSVLFFHTMRYKGELKS